MNLETILSVSAVAYLAVLLWLGVRIFNRRERWAKWTLVGAIFEVPLIYVLSIGPACWWVSRNGHQWLPDHYWPVGYCGANSETARKFICWYAQIGMRPFGRVYVPNKFGWGFRIDNYVPIPEFNAD